MNYYVVDGDAAAALWDTLPAIPDALDRDSHGKSDRRRLKEIASKIQKNSVVIRENANAENVVSLHGQLLPQSDGRGLGPAS